MSKKAAKLNAPKLPKIQSPRRFRRSAEGQQIPTDLPHQQISLDTEAFDQLLRSQGVTLVHHRAMPSPIGHGSRDTTRHPNSSDDRGSNDYLYKEAGCVTAHFSGNSGQAMAVDAGELKLGSAVVTFPRTYDTCGKEVIIAIYDRFFLKDCEALVANWQMMEYSGGPIDRLTYPVAHVDHLVDSRGKEYSEGHDFDIVGGAIKWRPNKGPGMEPTTGKGVVYSVRYTYVPHWYVKDILHEVRVTQTTDGTGNRKLERMPYQVVLQREFVFMNEQRGDDFIDADGQDARKIQASRSGKILGPR